MSSRLCKPALAVAAALLGAGPLLAPVAYADAETVTFSGGCGLLSSTSNPSSAQVRVSAGSAVTFENRLGKQATLTVGGQPVAVVGDGQDVSWPFAPGTAYVSLRPECSGIALNESYSSVEVVARSPQTTPPVAAPPAAGAPVVPPGAGDPADQVLNEPSAVADPDRTTGALPPADPATTAEALDAVGDPAAVPAGNNVAAEPLIPAAPAPGGVNGLLGLVAAVCVAGVTAAAIRAILSQRASRAAVA